MVYTIGETEVLAMATKAMNIKMDEGRLLEVKDVASVFHMTITDVVNEALNEYLPKMKREPFYRLTANVKEASAEESAEILSEIEMLTDDDLDINSTKKFTV